MKHIKPYKIFEAECLDIDNEIIQTCKDILLELNKNGSVSESIDELQMWIKEVTSTCRDIMLELQDVGMETDVRRSLYMKEKNSVLVDCTMSHQSPFRWSRFGIMEVYERLADYMRSEGFEEISRRTGSAGSFPFVDGKYQGGISFKKSGLDSDYIGNLRYLKKYNLEK